ncbi:MAG: putative assembly protein [Candidatus Accumulibacter appositus]|uniref:Putative assembly protein n=1 Tax=Candidatus Accumulibacter appositus TaxID=1454003 RepID=A0A011NU50_9PROT|nr:AsmA family protein [Accumulibacter sp.]EXI78876.1 MAG: putative assembly protein [Candidatus Accumulibacter appositus]HRF05551.1 AsmA family protein [Accumulibacter sp.]
MQMTATASSRRRWPSYVMLALVALLLALLSAAGWFLLDDNRVRVALEKGVTALSDRPFHVDGDFAISLGRITTVRGSDIRWLNPAWSKQPEMLAARNLALSVDLWSLVRGPIVISNAQADDATLFLEWSKEGQFNWAMGKSSSDERSGPLRLVLGETELRNVQIRARHPGMTDELVVDLVQARQHQDAEDMLLISADAVIDKRPIKAQGRVGPFRELIAGGAIDYHFDLQAPNISLKAGGHFDRRNAPGAPRMDVDLSAADAADVLRALALPELTTGSIALHAGLTPVGEHLDATLKGDFGAFRVDGSLTTKSLSSLDDFSLQLLSDGPGVAAFAKLLGVDGLPDEPYSLQVDASRSGKELQVRQFSYRSDGLRIEASGAAHSLPELVDLDLDIDAKVATLQRFGKLFSLPSLPKLPLGIKARMKRKGAGDSDVLQADFTLGNVAGEVSGKLSEKKDLAGSTFSYRASSPDLRELARARGIRVSDQGPFPGRVEGELVLLSERLRMARLAANIADNHLSASGEVDFRPTDTRLQLQPQLSGTDLYSLARLFLDEEKAAYFPVGPYQLGGKLRLQGSRLQFTSKDAQAGNSVFAFDGSLDFGKRTPSVDARVSAQGGNLAALLTPQILRGVPAAPFSLSTRLKMSEQGMVLNDLEFSLADSSLSGRLFTGWPSAPERIGFDVIATGSNLRASLPEIPGYLPPPVAFRVEAEGKADPDSIDIERLDGTFADASITLAGKLALKPAFSADAVRLSAKGPRLSELGSLHAWPLVDLPFSISGTMTGSTNSVRMDDFQATLGKSDLKGSMRITTVNRPRIDLDVRSDYLALQLVPESPQASATTAGDEATGGRSAQSDNKSGKLFSDKPLPFHVLRTFDGKLLASLAKVEGRHQQLIDVHAAATLQDGLLVVKQLQGQGRQGKVTANFTLDVRAKQPVVKGQLKASDVIFFVRGMAKEDEAKLPHHTLESEFSANGNSTSALAAGLDGHFWLRSSPGQFRSLDLDVLFGDFAFQLFSTLNPFAKKNTYSILNCGGVYLKASKGRVETAPAVVLQTDRLSVVSRGNIDLRSEKLDFGFNIVPLQGVGFSAGDLIKPFIKLGGTLAAPALDLNVANAAVEGGVAVATFGASLLAGSLWDRWISSPGACEKIADEARKLRLSQSP